MVHTAFIGLLLPLLLDVLYVETACYTDKGSYFEGSCAINIDTRPDSNHVYDLLPEYNEKLEPKKPGEKAIPVTRHHVIPFNVLRGFHNRMVQSGDANKFQKYLTAFKTQYQKYFEKRGKDKCKGQPSSCMDKFNADIANLNKLVTGLYQNKMTYKPNGGAAEGFDSYEEFYVWLPGNLFVGPSDRTDDPGEGFEVKANTIVGKSMYSQLQLAYNEMNKYAEQGAADISKLNNALVQIINSRLEPYPLNKNQWNIKDRKYSIKPSTKASLLTCVVPENNEEEELQTTTFTTATEDEKIPSNI